MSEFYAGRKILITGVSGFIGKVLMEKALRSLPDSVHLILLVRSKWGKSAEERVRAFTQTPVSIFLSRFSAQGALLIK